MQEQNAASTGSMVLTASPKAAQTPVIVREPVLPAHQRAHSNRYGTDFLLPTGGRSTEEEFYTSLDATITGGDVEDEEDDNPIQLELCEMVPEVSPDEIDEDLNLGTHESADIRTRAFPLGSSASGEAVGDLSILADQVPTVPLTDYKSFTTSLPQLPQHDHLEINIPSIKCASVPDFTEVKPVLPRINTIQKNHVVCLSSDYQLMRNRTRKQEPPSSSTNLQVLKRVWSGPLPLTREMEERIETLGAVLPNSQKAVLWTGIFLDIFTKLSILRQMGKFADHQDWTAFCIALTFFVFSGGCVALYWWTHYPVEALDAPGSPVRRQASGARLLGTPNGKDPSVRVYGVSKADVKRIIRAIGSVCAAFQLGTAFLAFRALFSSETRQRTVAYDLRGMRLVDTVFLTLILCLMQFFIGIRCSDPSTTCPGQPGFTPWLIVSIVASLAGSALSYTALDFNDIRIEYDRRHQVETLMFFMARLIELAARVQLLALFAAVMQGHFFTVVCGHAVLIVLALRLCPHPRSKLVWQKFSTTTEVKLGRLRLHIPQANDVKLLVACLAWPPSCYVSDATGRTGRFWWRDRMVARRPFSSLTLGNALIPWPMYMVIMGAEAAVLLGVLYPRMRQGHAMHWAWTHFMIAIILHMAWLFMAAIWAATVHMAAAAASPEDISRALARKQLESLKDMEKIAGSKVPGTGSGKGQGQDQEYKSSVVLGTEDGQGAATYYNPAADLQELRGGYSTLPQHYKLPDIKSIKGAASGLPPIPSPGHLSPLSNGRSPNSRAGTPSDLLLPSPSAGAGSRPVTPEGPQATRINPRGNEAAGGLPAGLTMEALGRIRFNLRDSV